jgi:hypothetical protein
VAETAERRENALTDWNPLPDVPRTPTQHR